MALSDRLELLLTADPSNLISAMDRSASAVESRSKTMESSIQRVGSAMLKIGGAGIGIGGLLTELGSGEQQAEQQLSAAIAGVGQSVSDYQDRIDSALSTEEKFGQSHEETDRALQTLTTAYGDTGKALDRLQLVTDIAAARHISLAQAADIVARAHAGSAKAFKLFGEQVVTDSNGNKDYEKSLDNIAQKLQGQASASVDSFTGKLKVLGTEVKDRAAEFGEKFGPVILGVSTGLTALGGSLSVVSAGFGKMKTAATEAIAVMGPLAVGGAIGLGIYEIGNQLGLLGERFTITDADAKQAADSLKAFFESGKDQNSQGLLNTLTGLIRGNDAYAKALVDAKTNTFEYTNAILAGGDAWAKYTDRLSHAKGLTDDDRAALQLLNKQVQDVASSTAQADIANKQLSSDDWSKALAAHAGDAVAALLDLESQGKVTAADVQGVADAANNLDAAKAKDLAKWFDTIRVNADKAQQAALQLAPADIRVQRGGLTIDRDQAAIKAAQDKIAWDKASGASAATLAADEDDLKSAKLDLTQAVLDQAQAQAELTKQQDAAKGVNETQDQQTQNYLGDLGNLSTNYADVNEQIREYIWATTQATGATQALRDSQLGLDRGALGASVGAAAGSPPAPLHLFAAGTRSAPPGMAMVGEHGPELVNFGGGERVYNASQTAGMMGKGDQTNHFTIIGRDALETADATARALNRRRYLDSAA